ncbi:MAG: hypothetical protein CMO44_13140 [Verrucomicrobiales bacterium]|nr:hypothetical protein [Verrucomicrobiales bacterium]
MEKEKILFLHQKTYLEPTYRIMAYVILKCVTQGSKLRVRFHAYENDGESTQNAYDNTYNCRFPKSIRTEGKFYRVPASDISLVHRLTPFYTVKRKNIQILNDYVVAPEKIFTVDTCVICFDAAPQTTFVPCGHRVCCQQCYDTYKTQNNDCPLCRKIISLVM